jgi:hypothetical protein
MHPIALIALPVLPCFGVLFVALHNCIPLGLASHDHWKFSIIFMVEFTSC